MFHVSGLVVMRRRFTIPIFLFVAALWCWAFVVEPYVFLVRRDVEVVRNAFPSGFENLKIVVVSDTHFGRGFHERWRLERIVASVNACNPDVILFLGDYTNGHFYQTAASDEDVVEVFSKFRAKYGKYTIMGNHDSMVGIDAMTRNLSRAGIVVLRNASAKCSTAFGDFYVAGIDDPLFQDYSYSKTLADVPANAPLIFLAHTPSVVREIPQRADFVLSGHTHGGQIRLPFVGNVFPLKNVPRKLVSGLAESGGHTVYVSRGLGTSRLAVRFFCPPEFTVLKIIPKK